MQLFDSLQKRLLVSFHYPSLKVISNLCFHDLLREALKPGTFQVLEL
jgi:hypothetical protein